MRYAESWWEHVPEENVQWDKKEAGTSELYLTTHSYRNQGPLRSTSTPSGRLPEDLIVFLWLPLFKVLLALHPGKQHANLFRDTLKPQ